MTTSRQSAVADAEAHGPHEPGKADFSIHVLGGTRTQTPERHYIDEWFESCVVVETEDAFYLLDCGHGAGYLIADQFADVRMKPIRGIFISHLDEDHVGGLWSFLHPKMDCVVVLPLPEAELQRCESFLELISVPYRLKTKIRFASMPIGYGFEDNGFRLETFPNDHLSALRAMPGLRYQPYEDYQPSFSFRVHYRGRKVIYSADYRTPLEIEPWLKEGADLAILENTHTPPMEVYTDMLAQYPNLPVIALTHFWYTQGDPVEVTAFFQQRLPASKIVMTTAGMEFRFDLNRRERGPEVISFAERIRRRQPRRYLSTAEMESLCRQRGIPIEWAIIGPFDNPRRGDNYTGLDQDHGVGPRPDFGRTFTGKNGQPIRWQKVPFQAIRQDGSIALDQLIGGEECLAYAYARFIVPKDGHYEILAGSDDGCRMRVDGQEVFYISRTKGAVADEYRIPLELKKGDHEVLMAVEQRFAAWQFFWRIMPAA